MMEHPLIGPNSFPGQGLSRRGTFNTIIEDEVQSSKVYLGEKFISRPETPLSTEQFFIRFVSDDDDDDDSICEEEQNDGSQKSVSPTFSKYSMLTPSKFTNLTPGSVDTRSTFSDFEYLQGSCRSTQFAVKHSLPLESYSITATTRKLENSGRKKQERKKYYVPLACSSNMKLPSKVEVNKKLPLSPGKTCEVLRPDTFDPRSSASNNGTPRSGFTPCWKSQEFAASLCSKNSNLTGSPKSDLLNNLRESEPGHSIRNTSLNTKSTRIMETKRKQLTGSVKGPYSSSVSDGSVPSEKSCEGSFGEFFDVDFLSNVSSDGRSTISLLQLDSEAMKMLDRLSNDKLASCVGQGWTSTKAEEAEKPLQTSDTTRMCKDKNEKLLQCPKERLAQNQGISGSIEQYLKDLRKRTSCELPSSSVAANFYKGSWRRKTRGASLISRSGSASDFSEIEVCSEHESRRDTGGGSSCVEDESTQGIGVERQYGKIIDGATRKWTGRSKSTSSLEWTLQWLRELPEIGIVQHENKQECHLGQSAGSGLCKNYFYLKDLPPLPLSVTNNREEKKISNQVIPGVEEQSRDVDKEEKCVKKREGIIERESFYVNSIGEIGKGSQENSEVEELQSHDVNKVGDKLRGIEIGEKGITKVLPEGDLKGIVEERVGRDRELEVWEVKLGSLIKRLICESITLQEILTPRWIVKALEYMNGGKLLVSPCSLVNERGEEKGGKDEIGEKLLVLDIDGWESSEWAWRVADKYPNYIICSIKLEEDEGNMRRHGTAFPERECSNHVEIEVENLWTLPFASNTFDLVSARNLQVMLRGKAWQGGRGEWVDRGVEEVYDLMMEEIYRVLKPGGYVEFTILDAEIVGGGSMVQRISKKFCEQLSKGGYDYRASRGFTERLKRTGFSCVRRAWMLLLMQDGHEHCEINRSTGANDPMLHKTRKGEDYGRRRNGKNDLADSGTWYDGNDEGRYDGTSWLCSTASSSLTMASIASYRTRDQLLSGGHEGDNSRVEGGNERVGKSDKTQFSESARMFCTDKGEYMCNMEEKPGLNFSSVRKSLSTMTLKGDLPGIIRKLDSEPDVGSLDASRATKAFKPSDNLPERLCDKYHNEKCAVKYYTTGGLLAAWTWERWMIKLRDELHVENVERWYEDMALTMLEATNSGAGWRVLNGWACK